MVIYKITNKINGKIYIGQTIKTIHERWRKHRNTAKRNKDNYVFYNAIRKYGEENFEVKVLCRCNTMEEMNHREAYYIKLFNSKSPNGYNLKVGGDNASGPNHPNFGRKASTETLKRMSIARSGSGNPNFGRFGKDSFRFGMKHSDETIERMSIRFTGENHPGFGKKRSKETRQKMSDNNGKSRAIICNESGQVYKSIAEASRSLGIGRPQISLVLSKKHRHTHHLTFSYVSDIIPEDRK